MEVRATSCCGLKELSWIQSETTPAGDVKAFCQHHKGLQGTLNKASIPGLVLFTSVEKLSKSATYTVKTGYGSKLAAYIVRNKLGTVTKSPMRVNRVNHPDHHLVGYFWAPSIAGLERWWKTNGKGRKSGFSAPNV